LVGGRCECQASLYLSPPPSSSLFPSPSLSLHPSLPPCHRQVRVRAQQRADDAMIVGGSSLAALRRNIRATTAEDKPAEEAELMGVLDAGPLLGVEEERDRDLALMDLMVA
jgi:hypothetical protein